MNEKRPPEGSNAEGAKPEYKMRDPRRPEVISAFDEDLQRQIREEKARRGIIDQGIMPVDPEILNNENFRTRLAKMPSEVAIAEGHYQRSVEMLDKLSSWEGYMAILETRTIFPGQSGPSEKDRVDRYAEAQLIFQHAADDWAGKQHALQTFQWAEHQPTPLKTALETLENQMRQEVAKAATAREALAKLEAITGLPADSPKLLEARQEVARLASMIRRFESALRSARGQI